MSQGYVYRLYQKTATGTSTIGATANITESNSVLVNVTMPGATWYLEVRPEAGLQEAPRGT